VINPGADRSFRDVMPSVDREWPATASFNSTPSRDSSVESRNHPPTLTESLECPRETPHCYASSLRTWWSRRYLKFARLPPAVQSGAICHSALPPARRLSSLLGQPPTRPCSLQDVAAPAAQHACDSKTVVSLRPVAIGMLCPRATRAIVRAFGRHGLFEHNGSKTSSFLARRIAPDVVNDPDCQQQIRLAPHRLRAPRPANRPRSAPLAVGCAVHRPRTRRGVERETGDTLAPQLGGALPPNAQRQGRTLAFRRRRI